MNATERRRRLLDAAEQALVASGPRELRLKDIAAAAAVTPAAVLYHYPDIDDLVRDIYEDASERWHLERVDRVRAEPDPTAMLTAMIATGMPASAEDASVRLLCELEGISVRNPEYARLMQELFDRQVELYAEVLLAGVESGDFSLTMPVVGAARALVALEDSLSYYILNEHPELDHAACSAIVRDTARVLTGAEI